VGSDCRRTKGGVGRHVEVDFAGTGSDAAMKIFASPFGDVGLSPETITERLFVGLARRWDMAVLVDGPTGRTLAGAALTADIKALAGGLAARGFGVGHRMALMAPNIPEFCTVFHASAWAGGTITPINPTYTAHEIRHQLLDSAAQILVTVPERLEVARNAIAGTSVAEIVVIGEAVGATPLATLMGAPLDAPAPVDPAEHVVALPYSSGTTGLPKGVMLTHRNLVVNLDQLASVVDIEPGEFALAFMPFFHIYGLEVMMNNYLAAGAGLVVMPRFDLEQFLRLAVTYKVRRLWIVPPVAIALAKHPIVDQFDLSAVEHVISAAAPLGGDLADAVGKRLGCTVTQAYGMTELSPASHGVPGASPRTGSVGLSIAGTACRIVDPDTGADRGVDEEGELWIKGPQVMKGYLNNAEATAATIDGDGWLHTGDIACFDADGHLFIRDRLKELIKYKGFQVAPAELEAALLTHPGIADAAVIGMSDAEAGEVPVAFLVAAGSGAPTLEDIQQHLADRLASYKRVGRIIYLDAIPKSPSGKILRRVLRKEFGV
jgi:acyl-CoA synthetase (AMP-forming)/AMP-acid ligase II